ncbi:GntR family transcriptional regulator [Hyphomonas johnsonii]|uniref:GntR family transcriptional regulator n=1 Tax=Hyphomonas johnsonii MHS-2 TaxID=1280950 RepID=A0A059FG15_9PROT|nr:GntR family transcriptional regulator [Hyphomonas johnsonii]KCZ89527.1 GntR family transcriptional regulator [Hyphomonas johnsonii MHS-2]
MLMVSGAGVQDFNIPKSEIDSHATTPLYQQIYALLRQKIEGGEVSFNARLPAEQALARSLGVSRITIKRAMNELASSGFVTRYRGKGTIVSYSATIPTVRGDYTSPMEHLHRLGFDTEISLKSIQVIEVDEEMARELFVPLGTMVQQVERVRHLENAPFSYIVNHTPMDIAARIDETELAWRPFATLLAEAGSPVVSAEQTILARSAEGPMAKELMLAEGAPVLTIRRVLRDENLRAIQYTIANYRPDRYQYHMRMSNIETLMPSE